jgi:hypothetical protein
MKTREGTQPPHETFCQVFSVQQLLFLSLFSTVSTPLLLLLFLDFELLYNPSSSSRACESVENVNHPVLTPS